jgi:predicted acetyltransferase
VKIDLNDARESAVDREWLGNVYPLYLHDLSEFDDHYYTLNERGLWEPDYLPSWLEGDTDHPLIISESGCRIGFALVNEGPSPYLMPGIGFRLSEFFVLRHHRRHGFGLQAAFALFGRFCGKWQLTVLPRNKPAICFWDRIISEYPGGLYPDGKNSSDVLYVFNTNQDRKGRTPHSGQEEKAADH